MQAQEPVSIHLSEKNGLPDKEFYDIIEDDEGFIWLCADKGFFRYDGKTFKSYTNEKQRGISVFGAKQDSLGRIWCNNISGQFFYIEDEKLHLFTDLSKLLKGELPQFIIKGEYLLVFSRGYIYRVNLKTKLLDYNYTPNDRQAFGEPFKAGETIYFTNGFSLESITSKNEFKKIFSTNLLQRNKDGTSIVQGKSRIFKTSS